jgi:hypothetical protein
MSIQETLPLHAPGVMDALDALRAVASEAEQKEHKAAVAHAAGLNALHEAVDAYNAKRQASIMQEFERRSLAWCTVCKKVSPQGEVALVLSEGSYQESCGYEGGDYCARTFSNLHNACAACRGVLAGKHGAFIKAPYGSEFMSSRCYSVEERDGKYWVDYSGGWVRLAPKKKASWEEPYKVPKTPLVVYEALALQWGLPPALHVTSKSGRLSHVLEEVSFEQKH